MIKKDVAKIKMLTYEKSNVDLKFYRRENMIYWIYNLGKHIVGSQAFPEEHQFYLKPHHFYYRLYNQLKQNDTEYVNNFNKEVNANKS